MTAGREFNAAALTLPLQNSVGVRCVAVLAVTQSSQAVDLSALYGNFTAPHFLTLIADTLPASNKIYVALGANSVGSISETAVGTGDTVCVPIADNQSIQGTILSGALRSSGVATGINSTWLYFKGSATGYLRIYRSSVQAAQGAGQFKPP